MTAVAGLDYALRNVHVALLDDGRAAPLLSHHQLGLDPASRTAVLSRLAMDLYREHGPVAVWLERPFVNRYQGRDGEERMNVSTALKLAQLVGNIEALFVAAGHVVRLIAPDSWRSAVMLPSGRSRAEKKRAAAETVRIEYGLNVSHDMADAILIARYGLAMQQRERAVAS
jgi:Holliday junction resolvasome RuvABC endonuclease subunit